MSDADDPATDKIQAGEVVPPDLQKPAYTCPWCGVYTTQSHHDARLVSGGNVQQAPFYFTICLNCKSFSVWQITGHHPITGFIGNLVFPQARGGPDPHAEMPDDVRGDYEEARTIVNNSPRGACALLRLAVQKLMVDLGQKGENINADIKALVAAGLPLEVQQALDVLRVVGNNAVHPGEMDLTDDVQTATGLFKVLNFIVENRIAQPKAIQAMYGDLPAAALEAIAKRDAPKS